MFSECFEMEPFASHIPASYDAQGEQSPTRGRLIQKVVAEEYKLRDLPQGTAISCWWLTLPVFYYLAVIAGGVIASISVGDVTAAFDNNCIFYANVTMKGLNFLNNSKILTRDNVDIIKWGDMDSCMFPEYTSVACVMYAGVLLVMVLQCGRGGGKSAFRGRGIAESWRIVPIAFVFNLIFLILSSIIFGNIQNGFSTFCDGMTQKDSSQILGNYSSCEDVLKYSFPWDKYNTNLYIQYVLAKVGASLQLAGSLLAFLTIIIRCCLPADFIVYRRRKILTVPGIQSSYDDGEDQEDIIEERSSGFIQSDNSRILTTAHCHSSTPAHASGSLGNTRVDGYQTFSSKDDTDSIHSFHSDTNLVESVPKIKNVGKLNN